MNGRMAALSLCLLGMVPLAGCANSLAVAEDSNVQSSLQYDTVPCPQLLAQRNGLMQRYQLPSDAKPVFSNAPTGFGTVLPDMRSSRQRDIQKARGEIDAMNRSIVRRQCEKPAKKAG